MSVFAAARDAKYAGLVLTLAFETLGDMELDTQEFTEDEKKALFMTSAIAGMACGQNGMSMDELFALLQSFQSWWSQEKITGQHAVETMVAAAETLKNNWKGTKEQTRDFLRGMILLAIADGMLTDNESTSLGMIAAVMGMSEEMQVVVREVLG